MWLRIYSVSTIIRSSTYEGVESEAFTFNTGQPWMPRMSWGKPVGSKVYIHLTYVYLG